MLPIEFSQPPLLGTSNKGKFLELSSLAQRFGFSVIGLSDPSFAAAGPIPHVAEVGLSYEANARLKALAYSRWSGRPCIADDAGLEVSMLGDLPGIYTAPWGFKRVQQELGIHRAVPARFVCCMVYAEPSGRTVSTTGVLEGELRNLHTDAAMYSLPFSTVFFPHGAQEPLSRLVERGYEGSHRSRALAALVKALA